MAFDKIVDSAKLDAGMTATANAIRAKTGGSGAIPWDSDMGFKAAVETIQTGGGIDTCTLTVSITDNEMSAIDKLVLTKVVDGKIVLSEDELTGMSGQETFTVPCDSFVFMYGTGGGNPNPTHSSNVTLLNNMYLDDYIYLYKMPSTPGSTATITHYCG